MRSLSTIFLFVLLSPVYCQAQDFKSIFMAMKQKYDSMDAFHIIMEVKAGEDAKSAPYYAEKFDLKKEGLNYVYSSKNNLMLMNDVHIVIVDREARQVIVNDRNKNGENGLDEQVKFNLDSLLSTTGVPQYLGEQSGNYVFSQQPKQGPVKTLSMFVDKETGLLSRIEYIYREPQFVSVEFSQFDTQPTFDSGTFADESVMTLDKGKYKPSAAFKGFQIIVAGAE